MTILALGDPHGILPSNLDSIIKNNQVDTIVCIGEIFPIKRDKNHKGTADFKTGEKILHKLCSYNIPIILFKGNMFFTKIGKEYYKQFKKSFQTKYPHLIIKKLGKVVVKKRTFIILDMIYEEFNYGFLGKYYTDPTKNEKRLNKLNHLLKKNQNAILLSHSPPFGHLDIAYNGKHLGSKILLKAINQSQPKLVLCGHIHEGKGSTNISRSKIINLGSEGDFKILEGF